MTNALNLTAPVDTLAMEFTREFDAPVEAVFRAHAEPDLVKQWLGPHGIEMEIREWDFRSHGGYRYLHENEHGKFSFNGVFHTVRENEFILQTFEFEGAPDIGEHRVHVVRGPWRRPHPAARPVDLPKRRGP